MNNSMVEITVDEARKNNSWCLLKWILQIIWSHSSLWICPNLEAPTPLVVRLMFDPAVSQNLHWPPTGYQSLINMETCKQFCFVSLLNANTCLEEREDQTLDCPEIIMSMVHRNCPGVQARPELNVNILSENYSFCPLRLWVHLEMHVLQFDGLCSETENEFTIENLLSFITDAFLCPPDYRQSMRREWCVEMNSAGTTGQVLVLHVCMFFISRS